MQDPVHSGFNVEYEYIKVGSWGGAHKGPTLGCDSFNTECAGSSFQWTLPLLAIYRKPGVSILMTRKYASTFTTSKSSDAETNLRTELTYIIYSARLTCKVYVWITRG